MLRKPLPLSTLSLYKCLTVQYTTGVQISECLSELNNNSRYSSNLIFVHNVIVFITSIIRQL